MKAYKVKVIVRNGKFTPIPSGVGVTIEVDSNHNTVEVKNDIAELTPGKGVLISESTNEDGRYLNCRFEGDEGDTKVLTSLHPLNS